VSHASSRMLYTERASRVHCVCNYPQHEWNSAKWCVMCPLQVTEGPRESQSRRENEGRAVERVKARERLRAVELRDLWDVNLLPFWNLTCAPMGHLWNLESASLVAFWYAIANVVRKCWQEDTHMCDTTRTHAHVRSRACFYLLGGVERETERERERALQLSSSLPASCSNFCTLLLCV
jgi:hypothetical protein